MVRLEPRDLTRAVECNVPLTSKNVGDVRMQIRSQVIPEIRRLEAIGVIKWYSVLIHDHVTVRLCPSDSVLTGDLINAIRICKDAKRVELSDISGFGGKFDDNLAAAWSIVGMSTEYAFGLIDECQAIDAATVIQAIHYVANVLAVDESQYLELVPW